MLFARTKLPTLFSYNCLLKVDLLAEGSSSRERLSSYKRNFGLFCLFIGYYIYIETSSPRLPGENARLEIKPSLGNGATCISFYYHMLGRDVNELKVLVNGKQQLSKKGSQGDKWNKAEFKVQEKATSVRLLLMLMNRIHDIQ